ncbi:hypothetical protein CK203_110630 [Vitis vinifera]|uniref:Reverse transcriptase domain-containing protein n=1 Tax=Vitis vinifera TaxID=29760 RepID=A0A438EYT7_VITVI|nr:hypothetical protein CK203_110630 [Vitis vinifera]
MARLLVKTDGKNLPRSLHVVVGSLCFTIQLWWEVPPWVSVAVPTQGRGWSKGDEGCMDSHVGSSVGHSGIQGAVRAIEEDRVEQVGVVSIEYGLGMAGGTEAGEGNDGKGKGVVEVSGDGSEGVVLKGKGNGLSAHWAESVKRGNIKLLGAHEDSGLRVSGQPICQEGLAQLDNVEGLKRVRAPISSCVESRLVEAIVGAMPLVVVKEKNGANEALLEEASRYPHSETFSFLSFGSQHPSSSSSSSSFCGEKKEADGREREAPFVLEKGVTEFEGGEMPTKVVEKVLEEEDKSVLGSWMNGNFVNFADVWGVAARKRRKFQKVSRSERELKKLESSVNYCGVGRSAEYFRLITEVGVLVVLGVEREFSRLETKMQEMSRTIVRSLSVGRCLDWKALNSRGASSGVLVFWDKRAYAEGRERDGGGLGGGLMPFRFENMWLKEKGFKEKVQAWWNRLEFGKVEVNKAMALNQVDFWDKVELTQPLSVQEVDARSGAKEDFKKWVLLEEILWRQKSRKVRLREGDRNTSFFLKIANAHRRRNLLSRVKINGSWLTEENEVEPVVAARLEEPFSEQEVLETLKGFCGDKAEFHNHGRFVRSLNATFIVLIPKKGGTEDLRDYRPISLVGGLYKWLAKVLANRLKMVVGKVVSKAQNAFMEGRQILDVVLVANEVIDAILKSNEEAVGAVVHLHSQFFCLANGSSSGFFQSSRGLRQGDPLSPYLFVIIMEAFSSLLRSVVGGGFVVACKERSRGGEGVQVSHLLFADDTLVFCGASKEQLLYLSWILMWFEVMSGLRINLDKSELISVGSVENAEELAAALGYKVGSLPTTYLGLPLGAPQRSLTIWDGVKERMRKKLARWKSQYISKGGRITLIQSTLAREVGPLKRSLILFGWSLVCLEKSNWGLGVKCLSILNKALLCKWNWRFAIEREAFWNQVIRRKYGEEQGGWCSKEAKGGMVWGCGNLSGRIGMLMLGLKMCSVAMKRVQQAVDDRVIWRETKCGKFSVKSLYKSLVSGPPASFPSSAIWKVYVQPRVSFFWVGSNLEKALTLDQLQKRGWALVNRCYLCQRHEESIDHILLHCCKDKDSLGVAFLYVRCAVGAASHC